MTADGSEILQEKVGKSLVRKFKDHCNFRLYTLRIHVLAHVVEVLWELGPLSVLEASPFGQYNMILNHSYMRSSKRRDT